MNFVNEVKKSLSYDKESGVLTRLYRADRTATWNTRYAGRPAFTAMDNNGYLRGQVGGRNTTAHRVAWILHYGFSPDVDIDHINNDRTDNRICNLRLADRSQNLQNAKLSKRNKSGYKGVSWSYSTNKWQARVTKGGVEHTVGYFLCPKEASEALNEFRSKLHGEFANNG